jgi:hypothetical protein
MKQQVKQNVDMKQQFATAVATAVADQQMSVCCKYT